MKSVLPRLVRSVLALLMVAMGLSACNTKVDNSDVEALAESLTTMQAPLKAEEREQLRDALIIIALSETGYLGEPPRDPTAIARDTVLGPALMRALNGEDFNKLLVRADGLRVQKEQRTLDAAEKARQDVMAKIEQVKIEMERLRNVQIEQPFYEWTRGDFMPQAVVEFRLVNNSGQAINGVRMRADLFTPEKQDPWLHETIVHELLRALPDQRSETFRLIPNQYSPWGDRHLQKRRDTRLAVQVINVRVGDAWMVSGDLEVLQKEQHSYEGIVEKSRGAISEIKARRAK